LLLLLRSLRRRGTALTRRRRALRARVAVPAAERHGGEVVGEVGLAAARRRRRGAGRRVAALRRRGGTLVLLLLLRHDGLLGLGLGVCARGREHVSEGSRTQRRRTDPPSERRERKSDAQNGGLAVVGVVACIQLGTCSCSSSPCPCPSSACGTSSSSSSSLIWSSTVLGGSYELVGGPDGSAPYGESLPNADAPRW